MVHVWVWSCRYSGLFCSALCMLTCSCMDFTFLFSSKHQRLSQSYWHLRAYDGRCVPGSHESSPAWASPAPSQSGSSRPWPWLPPASLVGLWSCSLSFYLWWSDWSQGCRWTTTAARKSSCAALLWQRIVWTGWCSYFAAVSAGSWLAPSSACHCCTQDGYSWRKLCFTQANGRQRGL